MAWVKFDDQFNLHPKVLRAGALPTLLHMKAIIWCCQYGTDGHIPSEAIDELVNWTASGVCICYDWPSVLDGDVRGKMELPDNKSMAKHLAKCGLWIANDDGSYQIHDFLDYQISAKESKTKKKKISNARSKAGSKGIAKRWQNDSKTIAPSPSPSPSPSPLIERDQGEPKKQEIELSDLEAQGFGRFGQLGGGVVARLGNLAPIAQWEWEAVLKTDGRSWNYAAKVIENLREEAAKPKKARAGPDPKEIDLNDKSCLEY